MESLPPYSPFLSPAEELYSARRRKVYDGRPGTRTTLLAATGTARAGENLERQEVQKHCPMTPRTALHVRVLSQGYAPCSHF